MAQSTEVSKGRAAYHYFTNMENLLLTGATACFLGKHLVSFLGKNAAKFPSLKNIGSSIENYFVFYEFASAMQSTHALFSVLKDGYDSSLGGAPPLVSEGAEKAVGLGKEEEKEDVPPYRKEGMPRSDTPYIGSIGACVAYKSVSNTCKIVSSLLFVHEACNRLGIVSKSFSPATQMVGSGLGALGYAIEIMDLRREFYEHPKDVQDGTVPTDQKIAPSNYTLIDNHRNHTQEARKFSAAFKLLDIGFKVMGVLTLLDTVKNAGLVGRVSQLAVDHSENIYGTITTAMSIVSFMRHLLYGATIRQLEHCDVNPKGGD